MNNTKQKTRFLGLKDLENLCREFAKSQGFYGRLLENLQDLTKEDRQQLNKEIKRQKLTTDLDLILWVES